MRLQRLQTALAERYSRFFRGESGSATVEFVLVIPLLAWCFIGTFTFFAAYREQSINVKAAYTIGDQLSRETDFITPAYMASLGELHDFLVQSNDSTRLRITAFEYEEDDDTFRVIWSRGVGLTGRVTDSSITDVRDRLPQMPDEEIAILTETWIDFVASDFVGMPEMEFYEAIVTRPRFADQICWNPIENGTSLTGVCQAGY
jgi:Flp pilus assembly pilin Flp